MSKEYMDYMVGLWIDPATTRKAKAKGPVRFLTATYTKKGHLTVRCKRDPKVVSREELSEVMVDLGMTHLQAWNAMVKRGIKVVEELPKVTKVKISM